MANTSGNKIKRTPLTNQRGYPYLPARLVDHNNSFSKKWFIVFYAWDIGQEKLVRKRIGKNELNKIKNLEQRRNEASTYIAELNQALSEGAYLQTDRSKEEIRAYDFHGYKLLNALTYVISYVQDIEKLEHTTVARYKYVKTTVQRFLKKEGISNDFLLRNVSHSFSKRLAEYMRNQNLANKTHNDLLIMFRSAIEKLRKLDITLFKEKNPVAVELLPETSYTHAAYTEDQLKKITAAIEPHNPQLLLFIRFIFFTLARPNEIRLMKVGHLQINHNRILMSGENAKTNREKFIGISPVFKKHIEDSGILRYEQDDYIFSRNGKPGPLHFGANYFYKRFIPFLNALGFKKLNRRYTMYSFKHSGAIQLYLTKQDPELIRQQCRHTSLAQTSRYLSELGLFTDFSGLDQWQGF